MPKTFKIGVVAPANRIEQDFANRAQEFFASLDLKNVEVVFHPQCFLERGHFAGSDKERAQAFLEFANDDSFDAIWAARGGYGSNRIAETVLAGITASAKKKIYLGYSDFGFLLAGLYREGCKVAHGPVVADLKRVQGEEAAKRAIDFLANRQRSTLEPTIAPDAPAVAFNLTILSNLAGTTLLPDLSGHVVMLEEIGEQDYRIDRSMFHLVESGALKGIMGIRMGEFSEIPPNDPVFGQETEGIVRHWCKKAGIPFLGKAQIGHNIANKIVPFGDWFFR